MRSGKTVLSFLLASLAIVAGGQFSSAAASGAIQLYSGVAYTGSSVSVPAQPRSCTEAPFAVRSVTNLTDVDLFLFKEPGCQGGAYAVTSLHQSANTLVPYRSYLVK
ncbi:hypothetical protein [Amycolatopsis thailandensis]|uniref:hypothetical protein n=1 Tax=Amycolatopsis thailandensis TaxID=589330 RepID=UPI00362BD836